MMASVFYLLYVLFLAAVFGEVFSTKVADEECLKQQNKCGACSLDHFTTKIMLSDNSKVRNEVVTAQNTIIQYGEASDVVKLFSQYTLTTSLNYFCCLNDEKKKKIAELLQADPGTTPATLHYQGASCMVGSDGITIMFVLDEPSETLLENWVGKTVNDYLRHNDIEVVDRKDPFNLPLAVVTGDYPLDDVLSKLNETSFSFAFNRFYVSGIIIHLD